MWHQTMLLLTLPLPVHVYKAFEFILINHRQSKYAAEQFSTEQIFLDGGETLNVVFAVSFVFPIFKYFGGFHKNKKTFTKPLYVVHHLL